MPLRVALPCAVRRPGWLACVLLVALAGCVQVEQIGGNPCDPDPCGAQKGVCGGWKGTCTIEGDHAKCGGWSWVAKTAKPTANGKALTAPAGYVTTDKTCDALDNDCDGRTDEDATVTATSCPKVGVCAEQVASGALCLSGKWRCEFVTPAFEVSESTCDGQDNDCDGQTDENAVAKATDCKRQGVCAGLAAPVCSPEGAWDCGYDAAADYEEAETLCDGKDNDCNGMADSGLAIAGLTCLTKGACALGVVQACAGGKAVCDYDEVVAFQAMESACDGIDNDCDGATDNLSGTNLPLQGTETAGCSEQGLCGVFKSAVHKNCQNGKLTCSYSGVPGYESPEGSCDNKDNDCDGAVDNGLPAPAKSPCGNQGVCAQGNALCAGGLVSCDFTGLIGKGYEVLEQTCDGKDNDCDGQTDETTAPAANGCKVTGVCAFGTAVTCATGGKPACDYSHVLGYQDSTETSCDGQDKDCDGNTDEAEALDVTKSGCGVGVCAGKGAATCAAGQWACATSQITGFETSEKTCDGKDNDCDGQTDEGLSDVSAASCVSIGVCGKGAAAACVGGKYLCNYAGSAGYETTEKTCDGLDNDCDGATDVGACAAGAACTSNDQCSSGCVTLLDGSGKVCADKAGQCASVGTGGKIAFTASSGGACTSGTTISTCTNGTWASSSACPSSFPACNGGACGVCAPNSPSCDPQDKTKVVKCAADGKSFTPSSTCGAGERCAGAGQCVVDGIFAASDTTSASSPVGVAIQGGFAVAWLNEVAGGAELRVRLFGSDGKAKGPSAVVAASKPAISGSRLGIAPIDSGFGLVWVTSDGAEQDIALQLFTGTGAESGSPIIANQNLVDGVQTEPAIASHAKGFVVAWSDVSIEGTGDFGIAAQRFALTGVPIGDVFAVNSDEAGGVEGDQKLPAIAARSTGEFLVLWNHPAAGGQVLGHSFASDGAAIGVNVTISAAANASSQPAIALGQNEFLAAWTATGVEASGQGIAVRHIDFAFKLGVVVAANTITAGNQDSPYIAVIPGGTGVLAWRSAGSVSQAAGTDIDGRDLSPVQGFSSEETVLSKSSSAGDQDAPHVFVLADGRAVYLWRSKPEAISGGKIEAIFR